MLILETAINRYLALDPEMLGKLAVFDGKVIKIEVTGIDQTYYLFPDASGIHVSREFEGSVDTLLRGTPISLFKMGVVSNTANMLLKGEVEINGDARLGHQFKKLLSQMEIDWAEPLSAIVGDGLAYQLHRSAKNLAQWSKHTASSVSSSISEYLQEESRDVVTETETAAALASAWYGLSSIMGL